MCGINGHAVPSTLRASTLAVEAMNRALRHRGPDDGGVASFEWAALGMRRLSIVDVESGRQPLERKTKTLVYNGEIYDHDVLRDELAAIGCTFHTRSDTEVLCAALTVWGEEALPRLNGMFAFAFADRERKTLLLARDALGIKPLYWWLSPVGELVFSSELASLLAHPSVPRELDRSSLALLLHDRYVADPWTLLEGVHQLPPGHLLRWHDGRVEVRAWSELRFEPRACDEDAALADLRTHLDDAVRAQMVADVPVGVFLSGGIDSSTVAAFAARASTRPIQTFSIGFARADHDESDIARRVAQHLGAEHHELRLEDHGFELGLFDRILLHAGQPLGDTSCIPTLAAAELAAQHVKVALSGDGGDELFGGYDYIAWAARVRRMSQSTPALVRRVGSAVLAGVGPFAPTAIAEPARRARKGLELSLRAPVEQLRGMRCLWNEDELERLFGARIALRPQIPHEARDAASLAALAPEEWAMQQLARTSMSGAILPKVDRMSMAAGLEVRVPLLDARIVEFARRLPLEHKLRGGVGKHLLREAGRTLLPPEVYTHKKQGFSIPLASWFNADFWELVDDLYAPGSRASALFERRELDRTLAAGRTRPVHAARHSEQAAATRVYLLAQVARWMDRFGVAA